MFEAPITRLTLYGDRISGNCLKTLWTAELCSLDHDWIDVDILKGETRTPEFLKLNPVGQIPLARWPDGRSLAQSNAIIWWMAQETASPLIPANAFQRAQMQSWLFWEQYSHETSIAVRRFRKHYLHLPDAEIDPQLKIKGEAALAILNRQLSDTEYLVGEGMTLADIALVAYTRLAHEGGFTLGDYPSVLAWITRIETDLGLAPLSTNSKNEAV